MASTTSDAKNDTETIGSKRKSFRPFPGGPLLTVQRKKRKTTENEWEWSEKELEKLQETYDTSRVQYEKKLDKYGSLMSATSKAIIEATVNMSFKRYIELMRVVCKMTALHDQLYNEAQENKLPTDWCKGLDTFHPIDITKTFFFHEPLDVPTPGDMYSCERAIQVWKEGEASNPGNFEWLRKQKYGDAFFFIITQLQESVVHLERNERPHANIGGVKIKNFW